jgi:predicted SnoaL-like aldol condensation-catalyzing enzyme
VQQLSRADDGGMNSTNNKQIVAEFITALFTNGDLTAVDRYLDPQFINHDPPLTNSPDGPEGVRQAAELFRRAFPDWRSDAEHQSSARRGRCVRSDADLVAQCRSGPVPAPRGSPRASPVAVQTWAGSVAGGSARRHE